ncbi:MAG: ABC transporter substrate-binding protein, partial [Oscillospiraceae bacterium]
MGKLKPLFAGILACAVLLCSAACAQSSPPEAALSEPLPAVNSFLDDDGVRIQFDAPFTRIISLYSAHTENLYALGAGDRVLGGYTTCVYPPEAALLATFNYNGDPEAVIAADPDLVLIRPFIRKKVPNYVAALQSAGIPVVSLYADSYEEFPAYIQKLALLTGSEEIARQKLIEFQQNIDAITAKTAGISDKQTVFLEATETNLRTVAAGSMGDMAIGFAGGINLAAGAQAMSPGGSIAEYGVERILSHADDIDVYVSQRGAMNAGGNLVSIGERAGYGAIKAVQNGRVYLINEKLISSPTFRYYKGVREMARFLYPALMDDLGDLQNDRITTKGDYAQLLVKALHLPIYLPTSSKANPVSQKAHGFGLFRDVHWEDPRFDAIETAVHGGYIEWEQTSDGQWFYPEQALSREKLAKTIFLLGEFQNKEINTPIADLARCEKPRIVQIL